ncbi:19928_t:CDS:2, partial [Racocetra fulgida]
SDVSMISAFNIKEFGVKKFKNHAIMKIIINILQRYDIILCQEVHLSEEMINQLVDSLSKFSVPYSYEATQPIGKNKYKERYLYLYSSYLNKKKKAELDKILNNNNLMWGIDHLSDTTVVLKCNAYDRFIFEVKNKERWIGKTGIFEFDKGWGNKKASMLVSDHYPIEFELKLD